MPKRKPEDDPILVSDKKPKNDENLPPIDKNSQAAQPSLRTQPPRAVKKPATVVIHIAPKKKRPSRTTLLAMRTRTNQYDEDGEELITSMVPDNGLTATPDRPALFAKIKEKLKKMPTHKELGKTISSTPGGSIDSAFTPENKHILFRSTFIGGLGSFYTSDKDAKIAKHPITSLTQDSLDALLDSEPGQAVKQPEQSIQEMQTIVTPKLLQESHDKFVKNLFRRKTSQAKVVAVPGKIKKASATQYVLASGIFKKKPQKSNEKSQNSNWTHGIPYGVLNEKAQIEKNLCAATDHANTAMMFIEGRYKLIADEYPEGYTLKVRSEQMEGTKIGIWIFVEIITSDYNWKLKFNAQDTNKPHITIDDYAKIAIESVIEHAKQKKAAPKPTK